MSNFSGKTAIGGALLLGLAGIGGSILFNMPKSSAQFKPIHTRFDTIDGVITDSTSGDLFSWMEDLDGEVRLVKLSKNTENDLRDEIEKDEKGKLNKKISDLQASNSSLKASLNSALAKIPETASIFERTNEFNDFLFNTQIKYRNKEKQMLYRIGVSIAPPKFYKEKDGSTNEYSISDRLATSNKACLDDVQRKSLTSLYENPKNRLVLRFADVDDFWLQDSLISLGKNYSNQPGYGYVVDATRAEGCKKFNKLVFHGTLSDFTPDNFSLISDGKLKFSKVVYRTVDPKDIKDATIRREENALERKASDLKWESDLNERDQKNFNNSENLEKKSEALDKKIKALKTKKDEKLAAEKRAKEKLEQEKLEKEMKEQEAS